VKPVQVHLTLKVYTVVEVVVYEPVVWAQVVLSELDATWLSVAKEVPVVLPM